MEYALQTLGVSYIDIIVLCRVAPDVPIEESVRGLQAMVDEGKARHIGVSEASASTIRRAHAVAPIYCIEQEWSLYARDCEEEVIPTCRELGIKIVAYSPLGRGFLTGNLSSTDGLDASDFRKHLPKFSAENIENNNRIVTAIKAFAESRGLTAGQVALAWLLHQGGDVHPIPGTTKVAHLAVNLEAENIVLSEADLEEIASILHNNPVSGDRYAYKGLTFHGNK